MRPKQLFILLVLLSNNFYVFSQKINYSERPSNYRLYPREKNDYAKVILSGSVTDIAFDSIIVRKYVDNLKTDSMKSALTFNVGQATFSLSDSIYADTVLYRYEVYLKNETDFLLQNTFDSVVCGDVYLINGQSNAVSSNGGTKRTDKFLRSFGKQCEWDAYNAADTLWGLAWNGAPGYYGVGGWGFEMMTKLKESQGIPIAVINGAGSGSNIDLHHRNVTNPTDLGGTSFYGKLLYRSQKAKLTNYVKAIFWHQGEANVGAYYMYNTVFKRLYNAWKIDYPNVQKVFVYQLHHGCGGENAGTASSKMREVQRNFVDSFPNVHVMSTVGLPGHDGCHYSPDGYKTMGQWMYRLVAQELYQVDFGFDVSPPNLKEAFYTSDSRKEIAIVFRNNQEIVWTETEKWGGIWRNTVDYFFLDGKGSVVESAKVIKDTLFLTLKASSTAKKITYLPDHYYPGSTTELYFGPWLYGTNGVGVLTFGDVLLSCKGNRFPSLIKEDFEVKKNSAIGTLVDTVKGTDPDGNKLYYFITAGNQNNTFTLDSITGILTIQTPPQSSQYYLNLLIRDNGICGLTATGSIIVKGLVNSVENTTYNSSLSVFPNPAKDYFDIAYNSSVVGDVTIQITDAGGKSVMTISDSKNTFQYNKRIQTNLEAGIYVLSIITDGKRNSVKLVIQ